MIKHHGLSIKFWKLLTHAVWNYHPDDYYIYDYDGEVESYHLAWQRIKRSVSRKLDWSHVGPDQEQLSVELGLQIPSPGLRVSGGHERLLRRMLRMSGSSLRLNSTVTQIQRHADLTFDVHWQHKSSNGSVSEHFGQFDAIILAAPFHNSRIEI